MAGTTRKPKIVTKYPWVRRNASGEQVKVPDDVARALKGYVNERREHFFVLTLDGQHKIINIHVVSVGTASRTIVHPREVFYPAILDNAVAVIVAHNHPSGKASPSEEDDEATRRVVSGGELLGITVCDHVVVTRDGCYSYALEEDWRNRHGQKNRGKNAAF